MVVLVVHVQQLFEGVHVNQVIGVDGGGSRVVFGIIRLGVAIVQDLFVVLLAMDLFPET